jgi:hypothetical protein
MTRRRQKFATQVEADLLAAIRDVAAQDGRQVQAVVEDAFRTYLEERRRGRPRPAVMAHYQASHARFASLYERLAR